MDSYELERHHTNVRMLLNLVDEIPSAYGQAMLEIIAADYRSILDDVIPMTRTPAGHHVPDTGD